MIKRHLIFLLLAASAVGASETRQADASEQSAGKSAPSAKGVAASSSAESAPAPSIVQVRASSNVVLPGQKILLAAKVAGASNESVELALVEGETGGSLALSRDYPDAVRGGPLWIYTAPSSPGTYHVIAKAGGRPHPDILELVVQPFVTGCTTRIGEVGVWQNITPPQVDLTSGDFFGMQALVIDPVNPSTIYVGRAMDGIYKSTDCGASWKKISVGRNSRAMASGRSWTMAIDPSNPNTIYTNQGYGVGGVFRTTNGGVDWDQILTPNVINVVPYGGFVHAISMNPNDSRHLLVGWHAECPPPRAKFCFAETIDGGTSWKLRDGHPSWAGDEGAVIDFLDSKSWLFASQSNGLWVSKNQGESWQHILGVSISHGRGQLYRAVDGSFYLGTAKGVLHSTDVTNWALLPESGELVMGLIGNGENLYFSKAFPYNAPGADPYFPFYTSPEGSRHNWTAMLSPAMRNGAAELHLDKIHRILYSTNMNAGLWRMIIH